MTEDILNYPSSSTTAASKRLVIRLSSLGDLVLSTSLLTAPTFSGNVDWLVASEFAILLAKNPRVGRTFSFERKGSGVLSWVNLCRELYSLNYEEVIDLHSSLRSHLAQVLFLLFSLRDGRRGPRWRRISKQRFRLIGLFLFKKYWPRIFRPVPWVQRYSSILQGDVRGRPDLSYLVRGLSPLVLQSPYLCVMPSAQWVGKRWSVESYVEVLRSLPVLPVILGSVKDSSSRELVERLKKEGVAHESGVGLWDLQQVAGVLAHSSGYFGNDTGLAHLAESVGVPAYMIFGPTSPGMGFGPWRAGSRSFEASLVCRPCGKDGRSCFRLGASRYRCLKEISSGELLRGLTEELNRRAILGDEENGK